MVETVAQKAWLLTVLIMTVALVNGSLTDSVTVLTKNGVVT